MEAVWRLSMQIGVLPQQQMSRIAQRARVFGKGSQHAAVRIEEKDMPGLGQLVLDATEHVKAQKRVQRPRLGRLVPEPAVRKPQGQQPAGIGEDMESAGFFRQKMFVNTPVQALPEHIVPSCQNEANGNFHVFHRWSGFRGTRHPYVRLHGRNHSLRCIPHSWKMKPFSSVHEKKISVSIHEKVE
jgi:hypothetical protein